jgi:osmoprotectant transport system permease protein
MIAVVLAIAVQVGSKQFTESVILAEIAVQTLRAAGVEAEHRREVGGTRVLWEALRGRQIQLYPEYTGTISEELLRGAADLPAELARRGMRMGGSLGFENTYAIGMRKTEASRLRIRSLSQLAAQRKLEIGLTNEFLRRQDGWPRLRKVYGFSDANVRGMDHQLAYRALRSGDIAATDLYSTDAEIQAADLLVLEDDRRAFPRYDAVLLQRADLPEAAVRALARLEGAISPAEMIAMNARALLGHVPEAQVAADFLRDKFGVAEDAKVRSAAQRIGRRTLEHLFLVAVSLAAAIAVAVPLGILAWRRPRLGQTILTLAGVIQTIPSLALLVFMIPLLGIGAGPALVALFLYSLLPILRGTHAGLTGIAPELRESAEALGLPPRAALRRIELPLATPSVLSGIKTAAVIDVGTATLGALIGAGGYGQSILTGIRLADTGLILEGAVPAGLLALAVQGAFDLVERLLVPRGLRL